VTLARLLTRGTPELLGRVLTLRSIRAGLPRLHLPRHVMVCWRTVLDGVPPAGRELAVVTAGPVAAYPEVVSPLHVRTLGAVARAEEAYGSIDLRLEGGTALAGYYLGHRQSEDLDDLASRSVPV